MSASHTYILSEYYISNITCTNPTSDMFKLHQVTSVMCTSYTTDLGKLLWSTLLYNIKFNIVSR